MQLSCQEWLQRALPKAPTSVHTGPHDLDLSSANHMLQTQIPPSATWADVGELWMFMIVTILCLSPLLLCWKPGNKSLQICPSIWQTPAFLSYLINRVSFIRKWTESEHGLHCGAVTSGYWDGTGTEQQDCLRHVYSTSCLGFQNECVNPC